MLLILISVSCAYNKISVWKYDKVCFNGREKKHLCNSRFDLSPNNVFHTTTKKFILETSPLINGGRRLLVPPM